MVHHDEDFAEGKFLLGEHLLSQDTAALVFDPSLGSHRPLANRYQVRPWGGGRLLLDAAQWRIRITGVSEGYGREPDRGLRRRSPERAFPDYQVTELGSMRAVAADRPRTGLRRLKALVCFRPVRPQVGVLVPAQLFLVEAVQSIQPVTEVRSGQLPSQVHQRDQVAPCLVSVRRAEGNPVGQVWQILRCDDLRTACVIHA